MVCFRLFVRSTCASDAERTLFERSSDDRIAAVQARCRMVHHTCHDIALAGPACLNNMHRSGEGVPCLQSRMPVRGELATDASDTRRPDPQDGTDRDPREADLPGPPAGGGVSPAHLHRRGRRGRHPLDVQPHRDLRGHRAPSTTAAAPSSTSLRLPRPRPPRARPLPVHRRGRGGRPAPVPGRRLARLHGPRRGADPRAGEGGVRVRLRRTARAGASSTSCSARASRSASACAPRPTSARTRSRSATPPSSSPRRSSTRSTGRTILVLGAGKMSELTAKHLRRATACSKVLVANRTYERAVELAEKFDGEAIHYDDLFDAHARGRHRHLLDRRHRTTSSPRTRSPAPCKGRKGRPLFLIDIAVPRDIDPAVNDLARRLPLRHRRPQRRRRDATSRSACARRERAEVIIDEEMARVRALARVDGGRAHRRRHPRQGRADPPGRAREGA